MIDYEITNLQKKIRLHDVWYTLYTYALIHVHISSKTLLISIRTHTRNLESSTPWNFEEKKSDWKSLITRIRKEKERRKSKKIYIHK